MKFKRENLKSIFYLTSNFIPSYILFKPLDKILLPAYNVVSDRYLPHINNLYKPKSTKQFSQDLDFLLKHFEPIDLPTLIRKVQQKEEINKNYLHLSFDD